MTDLFKMVGNGAEFITYVEVGNAFEPKSDPEISAGYATKNQLLNQILALVPDRSKISLTDWVTLFSDVSAQAESDEEFEHYVRGLWAL